MNYSTVILMLIALVSVPANAAVVKSTGKVSGQMAMVSSVLSTDFETAKKQVLDHTAKFVATIPRVQSASVFSETKFKETSRSPQSVTLEREKTVLVKFTQRNILPESLMKVEEKVTQCLTAACSPKVQLTLTGPIHTYETQHVARSGLADLKDSFSLSVILNKSTSSAQPGSKVDLQFKVTDKSYMDWLQQVLKRFSVSKVPNENEVLGSVVLWGHGSIREFFN